MRNEFHCPRCQSDDIIDRGDYIYCPQCDMTFEKEFLGNIDDEDILGEEEMDGFFKSFEDEMKDYKWDEDDDFLDD